MPSVFAAFYRPDLGDQPSGTLGLVAGSMPPSFTRPTFNQSEADYVNRAGLNIYSREGQAFRAAVMDSPGPGTDQLPLPQRQLLKGRELAAMPRSRAVVGFGFSVKRGRDSRGIVVREQTPLYRAPFGEKNGYQDFFGAFVTRAATVIPVVAGIRYQGQLPIALQPKVVKPDPWNDPTRGRP